MAKLTNKQIRKKLKTKFGKKGEKFHGYRWDNKQKRWEKKGHKPVKPKKPVRITTPAPAVAAAPAAPTPTQVVKTSTNKNTNISIAGASNNAYLTQLELQQQLATMTALELWQYTNAEAVDGIFSNVKLIAVLSETRRQYDPNDTIISSKPFIRNVERTSDNVLVIKIDGSTEGKSMSLEFFVEENIKTIGTEDY